MTKIKYYVGVPCPTCCDPKKYYSYAGKPGVMKYFYGWYTQECITCEGLGFVSKLKPWYLIVYQTILRWLLG